MKKPSTPRAPIIPRLNLPSISNSKSEGESNYEEINEICHKLKQIILGMNQNIDINKKIQSILQDTILNIYKLVNEKRYDPTFSTSSHTSSSKSNFNIDITITDSKGNIYVGKIKNGLKEGKGKMIYTNGNIYDGFWKNGLKHGKGVFKNTKKNEIYDGDFKENKACGKAKYISGNGDEYEGDIVNWVREGKGVYNFNNG